MTLGHVNACTATGTYLMNTCFGVKLSFQLPSALAGGDTVRAQYF